MHPYSTRGFKTDRCESFWSENFFAWHAFGAQSLNKKGGILVSIFDLLNLSQYLTF